MKGTGYRVQGAGHGNLRFWNVDFGSIIRTQESEIQNKKTLNREPYTLNHKVEKIL